MYIISIIIRSRAGRVTDPFLAFGVNELGREGHFLSVFMEVDDFDK